MSPDNVNKLVFLARNANLYFEVMCVCGGGGEGGGEAHVCCFSRYRCVTYIRTCTYVSTAHRMSSANIQGCVKCGLTRSRAITCTSPAPDQCQSLHHHRTLILVYEVFCNLIGWEGPEGTHWVGGTIGAHRVGGTIGAHWVGRTIGAHWVGRTIGAHWVGGTIGAHWVGGTIGAHWVGGTRGDIYACMHVYANKHHIISHQGNPRVQRNVGLLLVKNTGCRCSGESVTGTNYFTASGSKSWGYPFITAHCTA